VPTQTSRNRQEEKTSDNKVCRHKQVEIDKRRRPQRTKCADTNKKKRGEDLKRTSVPTQTNRNRQEEKTSENKCADTNKKRERERGEDLRK